MSTTSIAPGESTLESVTKQSTGAPAPKRAQKGRPGILVPAAGRRSPDTARGRLAREPLGASRRASWCCGPACRARAQGPAASALPRRPGHLQPGRFPPGAGRSMRAPRSPWRRLEAQTSVAAQGTGERRSPQGPSATTAHQVPAPPGHAPSLGCPPRRLNGKSARGGAKDKALGRVLGEPSKIYALPLRLVGPLLPAFTGPV